MSAKLSTIYIVEDDANMREMIMDFLKQYNSTVKGFFTGDACIKEIVNGKSAVPDLILMDYYLDASFASKYDGLDTLVKVVEICPETKVIMFTSVDNERIIKLAKEKGAIDYVVKDSNGFNNLKTVIDKSFEMN